MRRLPPFLPAFVVSLVLVASSGCGGDSATGTDAVGQAAAAGPLGAGGFAATNGDVGGTAGEDDAGNGSGENGGSSGTAPTGGSSGTGGLGGDSGTGGFGGSSGTGPSGGAGGSSDIGGSAASSGTDDAGGSGGGGGGTGGTAASGDAGGTAASGGTGGSGGAGGTGATAASGGTGGSGATSGAAAVCGNGILEGDETCDGECPSSCDDGDSCTSDAMSGDVATCDVVCTHTDISEPTDDDQCCPPGANANNDNDCAPFCRNGALEAGESCEGLELNGATCETLGFIGGTLGCERDCTFDTSRCDDMCLPSRVKWCSETGTHVRGPVLFGTDGQFQFASGRIFHALNPEDGSPAWSFSADNGLRPPHKASDGVVIVHTDDRGSPDCEIYGLDSATGEELWAFSVGEVDTLPILVSEGMVYVPTHDSDSDIYTLHVLDASDGSVAWTLDNEDEIEPLLATASGVAFVALGDHGEYERPLLALNSTNGSEVWSQPSVQNVQTLAVVDDSTLLLRLSDGLYAFDAADWGDKWQFETPDDDYLETHVLGDGVVYLRGSEYPVSGPETHRLYAIDPANGDELWRFTSEGPMETMALGPGGIIYGMSLEGHIWAVDSSDGTAVWSKQTEHRLDQVAVGNDGTVYCSGSNRVLAFDPANGDRRWGVHMDFMTRPWIAPDGALCVFSGYYVCAFFSPEEYGAAEELCTACRTECANESEIRACLPDGSEYESYQSCDEDQICRDAQCCDLAETQACFEGDLYWYDSCGVVGEIAQDCGEDQICEEDQCIDCTEQDHRGCFEGDAYWYDSCDRRGELFEACGSLEICRNGDCTTPISTGCNCGCTCSYCTFTITMICPSGGCPLTCEQVCLEECGSDPSCGSALGYSGTCNWI